MRLRRRLGQPASVWRETAAIAADPAANTPERVAQLVQKHRLDCKQNGMDESLTLCRLPQGRPALGLRDGRIAAFAPDARTAAGAKHCRKAGSRSICLAAGAEQKSASCGAKSSKPQAKRANAGVKAV